MKGWGILLLPVVALACSNLTDAGNGVVALEVRVPDSTRIAVGDSLQLFAVALDQNGDSTDAQILWRTGDSTITVDSLTGWVTGALPGNGRAQAFSGTLVSDPVSFTVVVRPDTLIIVGPVDDTIPAGTTTSQPLVVRVETTQPPGPASGVAVIYTLVPFGAALPPVQFANGAAVDTATSGADGTASLTVGLIGTPPPDSVAVTVQSARSNGTPVPGSGQQFLVRF